LRRGIRIVRHFSYRHLLFRFRSYSRNIACSSWSLDGKYVFVILASRRSGKPLWTPDKSVAGVFRQVEFHRFLKRILWTIVGAKVAEAASSIEVLGIPSLSTWYDRYAFFGADPSAYAASGAAIKVEEMSPSVAFLHDQSLFWKS